VRGVLALTRPLALALTLTLTLTVTLTLTITITMTMALGARRAGRPGRRPAADQGARLTLS